MVSTRTTGSDLISQQQTLRVANTKVPSHVLDEHGRSNAAREVGAERDDFGAGLPTSLMATARERYCTRALHGPGITLLQFRR